MHNRISRARLLTSAVLLSAGLVCAFSVAAAETATTKPAVRSAKAEQNKGRRNEKAHKTEVALASRTKTQKAQPSAKADAAARSLNSDEVATLKAQLAAQQKSCDWNTIDPNCDRVLISPSSSINTFFSSSLSSGSHKPDTLLASFEISRIVEQAQRSKECKEEVQRSYWLARSY